MPSEIKTQNYRMMSLNLGNRVIKHLFNMRNPRLD